MKEDCWELSIQSHVVRSYVDNQVVMRDKSFLAMVVGMSWSSRTSDWCTCVTCGWVTSGKEKALCKVQGSPSCLQRKGCACCRHDSQPVRGWVTDWQKDLQPGRSLSSDGCTALDGPQRLVHHQLWPDFPDGSVVTEHIYMDTHKVEAVFVGTGDLSVYHAPGVDTLAPQQSQGGTWKDHGSHAPCSEANHVVCKSPSWGRAKALPSSARAEEDPEQKGHREPRGCGPGHSAMRTSHAHLLMHVGVSIFVPMKNVMSVLELWPKLDIFFLSWLSSTNWSFFF